MEAWIVKCLCMFLTVLRLTKMHNKALEKNSEMLKVVFGCFKTQEMCEKAAKKLLFAIIHVLDQHKTQQMLETVI